MHQTLALFVEDFVSFCEDQRCMRLGGKGCVSDELCHLCNLPSDGEEMLSDSSRTFDCGCLRLSPDLAVIIAIAAFPRKGAMDYQSMCIYFNVAAVLPCQSIADSIRTEEKWRKPADCVDHI